MKPKRGKPYLSIVRTVDKADRPFNAKVATRTVRDPWGDGHITVTASIRDDPMGRLHARGRLAEHQYRAGLDMQAAFEAAEISGVKAMDPTKEPVDGSSARREPGSDRQRRAGLKLAHARAKLDKDSFALLQAVLGERLFLNQVASVRGWDAKITASRFKAALEQLAKLWGFTGQAPARRQIRDKHFEVARAAMAPKVAEVAEAA